MEEQNLHFFLPQDDSRNKINLVCCC